MTFLKKNRLKIIGATISFVSLYMVTESWHALGAHAYGNALMYAGGALAMAILPFMKIDTKMLRQPIGALADEAVRDPLPLRFRLAIGLVWLLVLSGLVSFFL